MPRPKKSKKVEETFEVPTPIAIEPPKEIEGLKVPDGAKIEGVSSTPTAEQVEDMEADDEKRKNFAVIHAGFMPLQLKGPDRWRIVNKRRQWISGVLPMREAVVLANKLNMKDPEQKRWNKQPGAWGAEEAIRAY